MKKINKVIEESNKSFNDIHFITEDALICPICNTAYIFDTFTFDLSCRTKDCEGIFETPSVRYQRQVKSFISQRDQKILSAIEEEVEDRKKVMNNLEGDFSLTIFNNIKTTPQGYRKLGYIHAISDIKLILKSAKEEKPHNPECERACACAGERERNHALCKKCENNN